MKIDLDISKNIVEQFDKYIGGEELENGFVIHPKIGTNQAESTFIELPGELEFYHFGLTQFKVPIGQTSNISGVMVRMQWLPSDKLKAMREEIIESFEE